MHDDLDRDLCTANVYRSPLPGHALSAVCARFAEAHRAEMPTNRSAAGRGAPDDPLATTIPFPLAVCCQFAHSCLAASSGNSTRAWGTVISLFCFPVLISGRIYRRLESGLYTFNLFGGACSDRGCKVSIGDARNGMH